MKAGKTLMEMAQEIERQTEAKKDFVVNSKAMHMDRGADVISFGNHDFELTNLCHAQLAARLNVPKQYYDRIRQDYPELVSKTVNHLLSYGPEQRRMVRTLDGKARALLSDRYRPLDNYEVLQATLPFIKEAGLSVESCDVTDTKMYLKAIDVQRVEVIRRKGFYDGGRHDKVETFQPGVVIGNSEVGLGSLYLSPGLHKVECTNLAVFKNEGITKVHLGGRAEADEKTNRYLSDQTRRAQDVAFWMKMKDVMRACIDGNLFATLVEAMKNASSDKIEAELEDVVECTAKSFNLLETERKGLLTAMVQEADYTRLGLANAITQFCQTLDDYDRSTELERIGGQVIEMGKTDWNKLSKALAA